MAEKTYNTGRVVGWSAYEEFLKETGTDPDKITNYIYQTLVTYGVTRIVQLSSAGWKASNGGKFYIQTVRVPGASWGAVPIVGLDYEYYMQVFTNPQAVDMTDTETATEATEELVDVVDKKAVEEAIGNIFGVYISDAQGRKVQSSVDDHGYLTFMAHPDVLKFQSDVSGLTGNTLRLIVRGLSLEDLDINELYFGPQGFVFAGNGLIEDCYHVTENINNLRVTATDYLTFAITGNAASSGSGFQDYEDIWVNLEGTVSGYLDIDLLREKGYLMSDEKVAEFITDMSAAKVHLTADAYNNIPKDDKSKYDYVVYGSADYTKKPAPANPIYILCIRKNDGYTGFGVALGYNGRAQVGCNKNNYNQPPLRHLNLMYSSGDDSHKVLLLKDKPMPDYIGAYWSKDNGWKGEVSYTQQNGTVSIEWSELKSRFGATFYPVGRNSYIICTVPTGVEYTDRLIEGKVIKIIGDVASGEDDTLIHAFYVCTESCFSDEKNTRIVLNRRGGYLEGGAEQDKEVRNKTEYAKITNWSFTLHDADENNTLDTYLVANGVFNQSRIYQNEAILINGYKLNEEYIVANVNNNGSAELIVYRSSGFPLKDANQGVSKYTGSKIKSEYTNAIQVDDFSSLLPQSGAVHASVYEDGDSTEYRTFIRGGIHDTITTGTLMQLKHSVSDDFHDTPNYRYQYIGVSNESNGKAILACSVSQKSGVDFSTLSGLTGHLDQGFPRSKMRDIPDASGSWYYDYAKQLSKLTVEEFFKAFGLDIEEYLHPDFQKTSMLKFLQNMVTYQHLGKEKSTTNKKTVGFEANYNLYTTARAQKLAQLPPAEDKYDPGAPVRASLNLHAKTDPDSFTSPGFFDAKYIDDNGKLGEAFNIANPDYPIWATIAKSRNGEQTMSVSLIDDEGKLLNSSGSEGTIEADTITPHDLLSGLALGKSVDNLRGMRVYRTKQKCNYLVTADGTRLYISTTEPKGDDILDGSIGIGW